MKKPIVFLGVVGLLLLALFLGRQLGLKSPPQGSLVAPAQIVATFEKVLQLAVNDINFNQVYEFKKDNLRFKLVEIPFTKQKSYLAVTGHGLIGFDLKEAAIAFNKPSNQLQIRLGPVRL